MAEDWRVFGIGLNKTGTTSLRLCLRKLGIGPAAPMDGEFRRPLLKALFADGDYEPAVRAAGPAPRARPSGWSASGAATISAK